MTGMSRLARPHRTARVLWLENNHFVYTEKEGVDIFLCCHHC